MTEARVQRATMIEGWKKEDGHTLAQLAKDSPKTEMIPLHGADGIVIPGFKGVHVDGSGVVEVRKDSWKFVDHKDMYLAVGESLDKVGEPYHVHRHWGNPTHQIAEVIIDQGFKADELMSLGEADFKAEDRLSNEAGLYYPGVLVESNYWGGNTVSFNVYRALCTNGMMMGKILSKIISCKHTTASVSQFFGAELETFMTSLFEGRMMDKIFSGMDKDLSTEKVIEFLQAEVGKRSVVAHIDDHPSRAKLFAGKKINAFAAYQILTGIQANTDISVGRRHMSLNTGTKFFNTFKLEVAA